MKGRSDFISDYLCWWSSLLRGTCYFQCFVLRMLKDDVVASVQRGARLVFYGLIPVGSGLARHRVASDALFVSNVANLRFTVLFCAVSVTGVCVRGCEQHRRVFVSLTSNLLHQHGLGQGDGGAAAAGVHGYHADLQAVPRGQVLDHVAAGLLHLLVDRFPVLGWARSKTGHVGQISRVEHELRVRSAKSRPP